MARSPYRRLPPAWALPSETDERDKTIEALRRQLTSLEAQQPDLQFSIAGCEDGPLSCEMTVYPPLEASQRAAFLAYAKAARPMQQSFSQQLPPQSKANQVGYALRTVMGSERWVPPSESAIRQYQQQDYPAWLAALEGWLATIHEQLNRRAVGQVEAHLQNAGAVPALSLLMSLEAQGGIVLLPPERDLQSADPTAGAALPAPPSAPAGRWENPLSGLARALQVVGHAIGAAGARVNRSDLHQQQLFAHDTGARPAPVPRMEPTARQRADHKQGMRQYRAP